MSSLRAIPEVANLDARISLLRIPPEMDIPVTPRVRRLIDTAEFRRLSRISQLGLVSLAYPAANHTRFEHSLGVYRLSLLYLKQLSYDDRFASAVSAEQAEVFIVAALLHDLGHWPFCHPIEDLRLPGVPIHEQFAARFMLTGELAELLRVDWKIEPQQVIALLNGPHEDVASRILNSLLSSPIDIDKMDYLSRDSLHAGVPYGRHFDQQRLIGSLCLNEAGDGLAITDKGRTAAEMMVFARYVMFSEVYWHHTVRAATGMLQRAFYLLHARLDCESLFRLGESEMVAELVRAGHGGPAAELLDGLFGPRRQLYKRLAQFSFFEQRDMYERLARRPYAVLVQVSASFANRLSTKLKRPIATHEILFDAPPEEREIEFDADVYFSKERRFRTLESISPVVRTLAKEQFDDYVKRVRIFAHPRIVAAVRELVDLNELLLSAIADTTE